MLPWRARVFFALAEALGLALFAVLLGLLLASMGLPMAPAPLPRPEQLPPPDEWAPRLTAKHLAKLDWRLSWGGGEWELLLGSAGTYQCERRASRSLWAGRWWVDAEGCWCVEEQWIDPDNLNAGGLMTWRVRWDKDERGLVNASRPRGHVILSDGSRGVKVSLHRKRSK